MGRLEEKTQDDGGNLRIWEPEYPIIGTRAIYKKTGKGTYETGVRGTFEVNEFDGIDSETINSYFATLELQGDGWTDKFSFAVRPLGTLSSWSLISLGDDNASGELEVQYTNGIGRIQTFNLTIDDKSDDYNRLKQYNLVGNAALGVI